MTSFIIKDKGYNFDSSWGLPFLLANNTFTRIPNDCISNILNDWENKFNLMIIKSTLTNILFKYANTLMKMFYCPSYMTSFAFIMANYLNALLHLHKHTVAISCKKSDFYIEIFTLWRGINIIFAISVIFV